MVIPDKIQKLIDNGWQCAVNEPPLCNGDRIIINPNTNEFMVLAYEEWNTIRTYEHIKPFRSIP